VDTTDLKGSLGTNNTSGNDIFNAVLGTGATLQSFDTVAGGAGTNTLNIASDVAAAQTFPASVTYSGLQNVNLSRSGAGTKPPPIKPHVWLMPRL
jgi:hypothetical protein